MANTSELINSLFTKIKKSYELMIDDEIIQGLQAKGIRFYHPLAELEHYLNSIIMQESAYREIISREQKLENELNKERKEKQELKNKLESTIAALLQFQDELNKS